MTTALQVVSPGFRTGAWRIAPDESVLELVVDGVVACEVAPWMDDATGRLAWWGAVGRDGFVEIDERLSEVCRVAALHAGVVAPLSPEVLARLGEAVTAAEEAVQASPTSLLDRLADLVAAILDEPLHTLAGAGPDGGREPLALRLSHFRPDLAETAATLLDEAGR